MKIAIVGYGKMGKAIEKLAISQGHEVVLRINRNNSSELTTENLSKADVAIEFTNPESAYDNISECLKCNIPVISGSTGWLDKKKEIEELVASTDGSFLYASNFSLGVNVLFDLNERLAKLLGTNKDYQLHIEEIHHTEKKDAPSGTAISLAEGIINNSDHRFKKWALDNEDEDAIEITAKRIKEVKGTHIISYTSAVDKISMSHEAFNRDGFALGALLAAKYVHDKKGVFTMKDVLNV
jgi:4-hydroxy-tetrahydrodipicolinate reductase